MPTPRRFATLCLAVILCVLTRPAIGDDATATGWTPEEILKVRSIEGAALAPGGAAAVYAVVDAEMDEKKSAFISRLYLWRAGDGEIRLTYGDTSATAQAFSPDGEWIAFLAKRDAHRDVYLIRADGGEAWKLTDAGTDVGAFRFFPDGKRIVFTATEPESEEEKKRKEGGDDARVVGEDLPRAQLWVVTIPETPGSVGETRQLTDGEYHVDPVYAGGFDVSPDGKTVAFAHAPRPTADDWTKADVSLVDVDSGEVRPFLKTGASESAPRFSPDGKHVAFLRTDDPPTWGFTLDVHVVASDGGEPRRLALTHDRWPGAILGWSADGAEVLVAERYRTGDRVWALPADGGAPRPLTDGERLLSSVALDATRTHLAYASETLTEPPELYVSALEPFAPERVSDVNAGLPDHPLGRTEVIRWRGADGLEIEGLLTYPVGYEAGERYPLLLNVHGGPMGLFQRAFLARPGYPIAGFAARGYAVLRANIRGSTGYGRDFRYANYQDWGGMDYRDLMAGVDHVIELGVADPERLGVLGWSYGGYMSSWIITQTDRFRAASIGAAPTDLVSFNGTADVASFIPDFLGAEHWEDPERYRRHSPIHHVGGVKTPALIEHGENDARVPLSQGHELRNALERQGIEVEMVVYPRTGHGIREPKLRRDMMRRNLEWFDRFLKPAEPGS